MIEALSRMPLDLDLFIFIILAHGNTHILRAAPLPARYQRGHACFLAQPCKFSCERTSDFQGFLHEA